MDTLWQNWKVAGAAGEGIKTTGMMFSKTALRQKYSTFDYTEYPSLIRGGHNTYQVTFGSDKVFSPERLTQVHVALNKNGLVLHQTEFLPETLIIYDSQDLNLDFSSLNLPGIPCDLPMSQIVNSAGADRVMINNVALGASVYLMHLDPAILASVIADTFGPKKEAVIQINQKVAQLGYEYAQSHFNLPNHPNSPNPNSHDTVSLTGNEAIALGLIAGGLKFYAAYPMTPSSSILHSLAEWQTKANLFVKHAEDEIGVINMCLGASFAGVRAACGTSGGGLCYMTEAIGLSGVAELPLVIINAQRPGPALGMPTWTGQGDLLFAISASQDEFPRIVLAPGDVFEAFELSRLALDLAEKYQIPVIILTDKHLSESAASTHFPQTVFNVASSSINSNPTPSENGFYPRYQLGSNSFTSRTIPGQTNGYYLCNSYEHDVYGLATEDSTTRTEQMHKRMSKLTAILNDVTPLFYQPEPNAIATLIGWGSTKNALLAAQLALHQQNLPVSVLNFSWLWPFPIQQFTTLFNNLPNPIIFEANTLNQLARLIRQETGIDIYHKRSKIDGRPFYPDEIVNWVKEII